MVRSGSRGCLPSQFLALSLNNAHGGGHAVVRRFRLNPAITRLRVCDIVGVLLADLAVVVNLVPQVIRSVTLVNLPLAVQILSIVRSLHGGVSWHRLLSIAVIEMGVFEEFDSAGIQRILDSLALSE